MKNYEPSFANRLGTAAKARQARLEKARAADPANDPGFNQRQAARRALNAEREARAAERAAIRLAERTRLAEEKIAKEAACVLALKAEQEAIAARTAEAQDRERLLEVERKAARDARYAARKARRR